MSVPPRGPKLQRLLDMMYRRPPYDKEEPKKIPIVVGGISWRDTPNLYDDIPDEEYDDGPTCGAGPAESAEPSFEPSVHSPLSFGVPPGLEPPSTSRDIAVPSLMGSISGAEVTQAGDNKGWSASINVPSRLHGLLIGTKQAKKKEMEEATQCRIVFPPRGTTGAHSSIIRISSAVDKENVMRCLDRIEATILAKEKSGLIRKDLTHFAAFPCNNPLVQKRFLCFKEMIMKVEDAADDSCRVPALFTPEGKLHITICMLQLHSDEEKQIANNTMAMLRAKHTKSFPLEMKINGLDTMTDDPVHTHVLFAKVHGEGLQEIADDIKNELYKAGLVSKAEGESSVKMHMTVMNSRYAALGKHGHQSRNYKDRKPFDVSTLLREHGDFDFGFFFLNRLSICNLLAIDEKTGYYKCFLKMNLSSDNSKEEDISE